MANYFLQQLVNGLTLGCVYALVAMGYTLVHGIIGQINLAHGEVFMTGAFHAFIALIVLGILGLLGGGYLPLALIIALLLSLVLTAAYGWATHRLIYRPLAGSSSHAALIAAIGLTIFLQEYVRLIQDAGNFWIDRLVTGRVVFAADSAFPVVVSYAHLLILAVTATVLSVFGLLVDRSPLGRAQRACAQDAGMAALLGVDVARTVGLTFAMGAGLAGVAGMIFTVHYGVINFYMGFVLGLKAFTAAIVGGIGSLPGAALGGLLIGLLETFWSAYLPIAYKDVVVFGALIAALVFRPSGLLGRPQVERLPGPGQPRR